MFRSSDEPEDKGTYERNWYNKILIMKKDAALNFDERNFYDEEYRDRNIKH